MATRKRTAPKGKGRGGQSGGANPRNDGRITEQQHDDAMRVLRAEYYQGSAASPQDIGERIKEREITDQDGLDQALRESVDGSYWVIYTHANFQVLMCSDNHDAYSEDSGSPPVDGDSVNWAYLAYWPWNATFSNRSTPRASLSSRRGSKERRRPRRTPPSGPSLTRRRTASRRR